MLHAGVVMSSSDALKLFINLKLITFLLQFTPPSMHCVVRIGLESTNFCTMATNT